MDNDSFLTEATTAELTTLSRATINRKVAAGEFPPPIYISRRRKAWQASAVRDWMAQKIAGTAPYSSEPHEHRLKSTSISA